MLAACIWARSIHVQKPWASERIRIRRRCRAAERVLRASTDDVHGADRACRDLFSEGVWTELWPSPTVTRGATAISRCDRQSVGDEAVGAANGRITSHHRAVPPCDRQHGTLVGYGGGPSGSSFCSSWNAAVPKPPHCSTRKIRLKRDTSRLCGILWSSDLCEYVVSIK